MKMKMSNNLKENINFRLNNFVKYSEMKDRTFYYNYVDDKIFYCMLCDESRTVLFDFEPLDHINKNFSEFDIERFFINLRLFYPSIVLPEENPMKSLFVKPRLNHADFCIELGSIDRDIDYSYKVDCSAGDSNYETP